MNLTEFLRASPFNPELHTLLERGDYYKIVGKDAPLDVYRAAGWNQVDREPLRKALGRAKKTTTKKSSA